jgi:hypothetical protein
MHRSSFLPLFLLITSALSAQEICDNGIDDDADGLIDLNDTTDCACGIAPVLLDGILPNPSFEDHDCIPTSYSQMDCAMGWSEGTFSTSDYFRTDGYVPAFIPQPLPGGGNACAGGYFCNDYMEYVGGCLMQPMLGGESYELTMSMAGFEIDNFLNTTTTMDLSPVDVTIYGLSTCPSFPTNVSLCPGNEGWTELGHASYPPSGLWSTITVTLLPTFDVYAIMMGSPCTLPADYPDVFDPWLAYFLMDGLSISTSGTVGASITSEGNWCDGDLVLTAHPNSLVSGYQWYQDGIAIQGASDTVLAVSALSLDSGDYVFRAFSDTSCTTSTFHVETVIEPPPYLALTVDGLWCPLPGTYQWYLNGTLIAGANSAYYLPDESGLYTVELTNSQGCSTLSYPFDWISSAIAASSGQGLEFSYSPDDATLRVRGSRDPSTLTLYDASGRVVFTRPVIGPDIRIQLTSTAHGVYLARMGDQSFRFVR